MAKKRANGALERYRKSSERFKELKESDLASLKSSIDIPTKIFSDRTVAVLEAIVEYLKDKGLTYHEIAVRLNRDDRTIWTVYQRAKKKHDRLNPSATSSIDIPLSVLTNRKLSIFESVVVFLKEKRELKYSQIVSLTNRNDRTIWTVYSRAVKKRGDAHA